MPASLAAGDRQVILEIIEHCAPLGLVPRLRQFHQQHADVDIVRREGTWQAAIHSPGSVRTVVRWELRELLRTTVTRHQRSRCDSPPSPAQHVGLPLDFRLAETGTGSVRARMSRNAVTSRPDLT
jgi:hypothetical protein